MIDYLEKHISRHPKLQPRDVLKFCYQAVRGPEHLLTDKSGVAEYLEMEFENVNEAVGALYEPLSEDFVHIDLAAWKQRKLPIEWLLNMFLASANPVENGEAKLKICLDAVSGLELPFEREVWEKQLAEYINAGLPAVRHSPEYRDEYAPAYRVVSSAFVRILPILERIPDCGREVPFVIAIDGRAASGKSTVAKLLSTVLKCDILHMDDFFLPPLLRTEERLSEAGGNIHYERFSEDVLPYIKNPKTFSYRVFDCGIMDYMGLRSIESSVFRIVEGSYSQHPFFGDYADLRVFSHVDADEQQRRILNRDGEYMLTMFKDKWIPMEEQYIRSFGPDDKSLVII